MTAEQFAYWLQGFAELHPEPPTKEQWQSMREHLALVFDKKTPPVAIPKIDLSKNAEVRDLVEASRKGYQQPPVESWPWPQYWLNHGIKPGVITC